MQLSDLKAWLSIMQHLSWHGVLGDNKDLPLPRYHYLGLRQFEGNYIAAWFLMVEQSKSANQTCSKPSRSDGSEHTRSS